MRRPRVAIVAFILAAAILAICPAVALADTLRGRVTDANGLPISGARIMLLRTLALETTLIADDTGRYGPETVRAGTYEALAIARGYIADPVTVTIGAGSAVVVLDLTMQPVPVSDYIVVTAPPVGVEALARVTSSATVFDRADIVSLQATSLADVLRLVPGLQVLSRGGAGAETMLSGWGGGSGDVLILVDGVPQNLFGGSFDAAHISAADIAHVDVVRGADSVTQSVGAASAIVRVTTLSAASSRLDVTAEGGLEPSGHITASFGQNRDEWKWNSTAEWLGTRGQNGRITPAGAVVGNDDYTRVGGSASVMWQDQPDRFARWQGRVINTSRGYPGPWGADPLGLAPGIDLASRATGRAEFTSVTALLTGSDTLSHRLDASFAHWRGDVTSVARPNTISTRRLKFHYQVDAVIERTLLVSAGVEREWERAVDSLVRDSANVPVLLSRSFTSWFTEAQKSFGTRVFMTAGGRWDIAEREPLAGNDQAGETRQALGKEVLYHLNARGAMTAMLFRDDHGASASVRVSAGTALKPLSAEDIGFSANPGLRPERSRMVLAGADLIAPQSRVILNADAFWYRFDDLIVPIAVQENGIRRIVVDNLAGARVRGATAGAKLRLPSHLIASGSLTWLETRVVDARCDCSTPLPLGDSSGLARRPKLAGSASLVWTRGVHSAFVTAGGRGVMRDLEPVRGEQLFDNPGYLELSAGVSVAIFSPDTRFFMRVSNLLDRRYEEILGYPAPRRAIVIGLRLTARP